MGIAIEMLGEEMSVGCVYLIIKDTYEGVKTNVRTLLGNTNEFPGGIGQHSFKSIFFNFLMDELTRGILDEAP